MQFQKYMLIEMKEKLEALNASMVVLEQDFEDGTIDERSIGNVLQCVDNLDRNVTKRAYQCF